MLSCVHCMLQNMTKATYADGSPAPIPCSAFNHDGTIYAYALSYDWSRGFQVRGGGGGSNPTQRVAVLVMNGAGKRTLYGAEVATAVGKISWHAWHSALVLVGGGVLM